MYCLGFEGRDFKLGYFELGFWIAEMWNIGGFVFSMIWKFFGRVGVDFELVFEFVLFDLVMFSNY